MAKIKLSALVSEMRGKLNGSVFSKNRGGAYIRTKVTPVNPQTTAQMAVRSALTNISQSWRALTAAQRAAWNGAVSNFTGTDIFGDIKTPSGINLYNKLNLNLNAIAEAPISAPPAAVSVGFFDSLAIVAGAGAGTVASTFTTVGESADQTVIVEATPCLSPGKDFVKSEYRQVGTFAGNAASPQALGAMIVAKFGAMTAGQKLFVRFKFVDKNTGVSGQYTSASVIVGA
jgi:hypothetical protein